MRLVTRYPVDRYLVESSKQFEMANVIEDDFWQLEPTLKPEDDILLRRLHEMLQSTADDLKVLSGELIRLHEPGVQVKTPTMPLDHDFNDRVHIEEVVNAKFYGHKIVDSTNLQDTTPKEKINNERFNKIKKPIVTTNASMQTQGQSVPKKKIYKKLGVSRLKTVQIEATADYNTEIKKEESKAPTVVYNEMAHVYEQNPIEIPRLKLQVQHMPSINIRSELKEQKVLHLDILPEDIVQRTSSDKRNIAVVEIQHTDPKPAQSIACVIETKYHQQFNASRSNRKLTKMSTCESSESNNSDTIHKLNTQKLLKSTIRISPKNSARNKKTLVTAQRDKKDKELKRTHLNLDEWKKKLNSVYGQPLSGRRNKSFSQTKGNAKKSPKISFKNKKTKRVSNFLNNGEYIPYSQLTLGGVRLSDIEREISDNPIKNDVPLSPILDKILSSRENSFRHERNKEKSPRVLSTSDENLLQEVIEIEKKVSNTLLENDKKISKKSSPKSQNPDSNEDESHQDSYPDDFEEANKSDDNTSKQTSQRDDDGTDKNLSLDCKSEEIKNATYIKSSKLSLKDTVDIHEFIHSVEMQDISTQSQNTQILSLKETQTSPTNERPSLVPIHNDLWTARSIDPKKDVEEMFKLEKELIKKLIIDEYGDVLEKTINKPSTSKECNNGHIESKNNIVSQKITQTSPTRAKSIMTSPTKTKTRTTSPFTLNLTVDHPTSPLLLVQQHKEIQTELEQSDNPDQIDITINLSSPRFSLKLPQSSRELLSNLELCSQPSATEVQENCNKNETCAETKPQTLRNPASSSTSIDADASSSEISSLGEVKFKLKRKLRRHHNRQQLSSESSSTSVISRSEFSGGILPLKSDGEVASSRKKGNTTRTKTDDDSFGQL